MYTIKHAAEVTGLAPATMRAWEQRYGIVIPHRTESGYRLYDDEAVRALTIMAALVAQGWSARQAAEETQRRVAVPRSPVPGSPAPVPTRGEVPSLPAPSISAPSMPFPPAEEFIEAAATVDAARLTAILDERFATSSFESVVDGWLMPSLVALGEAWSHGRVSVAGEHLASYAVMRRLAAAYDAASSAPRGAATTGAAGTAPGPRVLAGLPPGSRHELGVLAFAVACRRAGLPTTYLGADLPADDWSTAVGTHNARAVALSALTEADLPALEAVAARLRADHPTVLIAVGGAAQQWAPAGCLRLGHQIGSGAALLTDALAPAGERRA